MQHFPRLRCSCLYKFCRVSRKICYGILKWYPNNDEGGFYVLFCLLLILWLHHCTEKRYDIGFHISLKNSIWSATNCPLQTIPTVRYLKNIMCTAVSRDSFVHMQIYVFNRQRWSHKFSFLVHNLTIRKSQKRLGMEIAKKIGYTNRNSANWHICRRYSNCKKISVAHLCSQQKKYKFGHL